MTGAGKNKVRRMAGWFLAWLLGLGAWTATAGEDWQTPLAGMPLGTNVAELNATNCVKIMLRAFQSNSTVKALVFMPGATDEFYFFHRARAVLTNANPSLLDAVNALTNQSRIQATFRPPFLLLHAAADPLEPLAIIHDAPTAAKIQQRRFIAHALYNDRDWDFMLPILKKYCGVTFTPKMYSKYSFHFFRHSFAGWNLTSWEALEVMSLAGKTTFTVEKKQVNFQGDER